MIVPQIYSFSVPLLSLLLTHLDTTTAYPFKRAILPHEIRASSPNLAAYTPVLTDGTSTLPTPTSTPVSILLGRGTQNYTCLTPTSVPISTGAIATLFNVSPLLTTHTIPTGQTILNTLPNALISLSVAQIASSSLPIVGSHSFTATGVPEWDLFGVDGGLMLYGASVGDILAPAGANAGPLGYGAVDWKALVATGGSVGLEGVWRVETAGGKAPGSCEGVGVGGTVESQYAAMYWFYG